MKFFVVALSLFAVAAAAATSPDAAAEARRKLLAMEHEEIHDKLGQFALRYVSAEGTEVSQRGRLVPGPNGTYTMIFATKTRHTSPSTKVDGTHIQGNHLPVSVTAEPSDAAP